MGGYLAFDAAFLESDRFAAAAIHGMRLADDYAGIVDRASRKIPIALYVGDRDPLHPPQAVRTTRDFLLRKGFPVRYVELDRHGHDYYERAAWIDADAWEHFTLGSAPSTGANRTPSSSP
jgi:predicted esterase